MTRGPTTTPGDSLADAVKPLSDEELQALARLFPLPPDLIWDAAFSAAKQAGLSDDEASDAADATLASYVVRQSP